MGAHPYAAEKALRQAQRWGEPALRRAFELFLHSDVSLKTGGGSEVLDALVIALCGPQNQKRPGMSRGA